MKSRIHIIMKHDLVNYPPMQSLLEVLTELGREVFYLGLCTDARKREYYEKKGVKFIPITYIPKVGALAMIKTQFAYRKSVKEYVRDNYKKDTDLIWYEYTDSAYMLYEVLKGTDYLVHFYEFTRIKFSWKYELLYRGYDMGDFVRGACAVIHCEYNRAHITRGLFGLKNLPFVLPNKPYPDNANYDNIPDEVQILVDSVKGKIAGRKAILYQGVFESNERRLEEFCEAIKEMPEDYVLVAMGGGARYYENLKKRYESDRILFVPFIKSPYHLLVTKLASIGVLSYFPLDNSYAGVINPLYCAPNKIFEYSKFGIPMISNDLPGLKAMYHEFNCGRVVPYPITPTSIVNTISDIMNDYERISEGSKNFYNSVNVKEIVTKILSAI